SEYNVNTLCFGFFPQRLAYRFSQFGIPAVRHCRSGREAGCRKRRIQPQMVTSSRLFPDSVRAVGAEDRRDSQTLKVPGLPLAFPAQDRRFFLKCHPIYDISMFQLSPSSFVRTSPRLILRLSLRENYFEHKEE